MYADDGIVMSDIGEDLLVMLNAMANYGQEFCVKFSEVKSKVIVINGTNDDIDSEW